MKKKDFVREIKNKLKQNAEIDFYLIDDNCFLKIVDIGMNEDIDDPKNKIRGGIVFERIYKERSIHENI